MNEKSEKPTLYSYCIPIDDGAAPNPYWDTCTLAICKPVIRRVANIGDWIVGLGSKNSPIGDIHNKIVYIMKISNKLTFAQYDEFCKTNLTKKIPVITNEDPIYHLGDCIYDFSKYPNVEQRKGVHKEGNQPIDLGGKYVLLSDHFYYFGDKPYSLPKKFYAIIKDGQGHKSTFNDPYVLDFIAWLEKTNLQPNTLYGRPQIKIDLNKDREIVCKCAKIRKESDELDELQKC